MSWSKTIVVYFDKAKKQSKVIRPTEKFSGDVATYVRDMFNDKIIHEDLSVSYQRNYESFEVIGD